ncbi:GNAT family N-acetyltransferase [Niveibacterium microcysteis]|uniref:GNAT family N-acetyltransferase n=1 Tax=Niveibacterium microcysteis TaxID=2811415 RepID=A0ABX7MB42_9RHOO|nr:GNAT family N-acetyltransferase [Niveibacterium microcysteis]
MTRENAISEARLSELGITVASWGEQVASGALLGYVFEPVERVAGYCFGDVSTGEIVVLALRPEFEGRGVGRALLHHTMLSLQILGHVRLFLGCSNRPEVRSFGFYRHLGWRPTGRVDKYGDQELEYRFG